MAALIRGGRTACFYGFKRAISRPPTIKSLSTVPTSRTKYVPSKLTAIRQLSLRWCSAVASDNFESAVEEDVEDAAPFDNNVRRQLEVLNHTAKNTGRVPFGKINSILTSIKNEDKLSGMDGAMLIRCTGKLLVRLKPEDRDVKFRRVWKKLQDIGTEFDIVHYNAALRAQLENEIKISPTEFLEELQSKGLLPNRLTYQLLLSAYCQDGDIEGASKILEHMQNQGMAVGELVFQSLMTGYMKQGNPDGAKDVLESMRSSGLEPTNASYATLACGYAEKGDIEGIKEMIKAAEKDDVPLKSKGLCEIVEVMAKNGFGNLVPEVITVMADCAIFGKDIVNTCLSLIAQDHDDVAIALYNILPAPFPPASEHPIVQEFLMKNVTFDELKEAVSKLTCFSSGLSPEDLEPLALFAIRVNKYSIARDILQTLKEQGKDIQPHQLWPVMRGQTDIDELFKTVAFCRELYDKEEVCVIEISHNALQRLVNSNMTVAEIIEKFQEMGFSSEALSSLRFYSYLYNGQYEEAVNEAKEGNLQINTRLAKQILTVQYKQHKNMEITFRGLKELNGVLNSGGALELNSQTMLNFLIEQGLKKDGVEQMISLFSEMDLKVFDKFEPALKRQMKRFNITEEMQEKLQSLITAPYKFEPITFDELNKMKIEEVEEMYQKEKDMGRRPRFAISKNLLEKYCRKGLVDKVDTIKAELGPDANLPSSTVLNLGLLAAKYKSNVDEALSYRKKLQTQYPDFKAYDTLSLRIALLQAQEGKIDEAIALVKEHAEIFANRRSTNADTYAVEGVALDMLNAMDKAGASLEQIDEMAELLMDGYVKKGTFSILARVMDIYVKRNDLDRALDKMEKYSKDYSRAPSFSIIIDKLVEAEDAQRLQRAVDVLTPLLGERNVLHHLIISFVRNGKLKHARKIIETPNLRANMQLLKQQIDVMINQNKATELESLVEITQEMAGIDRDEMIFSLIRMYSRDKNIDKAMEAYSRYEEENVIPSPRTLRYFGKVLESNDKPVPFIIPDIPVKKTPIRESGEGEAPKDELSVALEDTTDVKINELLRRAANDKSLEEQLVRDLQLMYKHRKVNVFKRVTNRMGQEGLEEMLQAVEENVNNFETKKFLSQRKFMASVVNGKGEETVEQLRLEPERLQECINMTGLNFVKEKQPQLLPKLEELIMMQVGSSSTLFSMMFSRFIETDRIQEAQNLASQYPELKKNVGLINVLMRLGKNNKADREEVVLKLKEIFSGDENSAKFLGQIFTNLIDMHCKKGNWEKGLSYYKQAVEEGVDTDNLAARTLLTLESQLQHNNQPLPWKAGSIQDRAKSKQQKQQESSDSSDSDSSDSDSSDDEKDVKKSTR